MIISSIPSSTTIVPLIVFYNSSSLAVFSSYYRSSPINGSIDRSSITTFVSATDKSKKSWYTSLVLSSVQRYFRLKANH